MPDIETFQKIYDMLDKADPLSYDCGELCGAACCRSDSFCDSLEPCIYLLPGEKEYLESVGADMEIMEEPSGDQSLQGSCGNKVFTAVCRGPETCERRSRPIQCRSFPLWPYFTDDGELILSYYDGELPYVCPLIYDSRKLRADFVKAVFNAWEILLRDEAVKEMLSSCF